MTDILWDNTGGQFTVVTGIYFAYCGWCGAILGRQFWQTWTKKRGG